MRPFISVSHADGVARVVIDRPDKRNAMTVAMWHDLAAIFLELAGDASVRAVVITGNGLSFCAGADISALSADDAVMKAAVSAAETAIRGIGVPTVAAISGHCMGGGTQIAVACDLRYADSSARFAVPPAKLAVVYPPDSTRALVALIGPSAVKRLIFTAETIDASEALRLGLVDRLVPVGELDLVVENLLASLAGRAMITQTSTKRIVNALVDQTSGEAEYRHALEAWAMSGDGVEGPASFLAKRDPEFGWHPAG